MFTFVGVITIEGRVLKCYPKYLLDTTAPKTELKQVLKVLEKYNSKEQIIRMPTEMSEIIEKGSVSLAMMKRLGLEDIQVRLLPAKTVFTHYLKNTKLDIQDLNLR